MGRSSSSPTCFNNGAAVGLGQLTADLGDELGRADAHRGCQAVRGRLDFVLELRDQQFQTRSAEVGRIRRRPKINKCLSKESGSTSGESWCNTSMTWRLATQRGASAGGNAA